jgi:hypothetical protein
MVAQRHHTGKTTTFKTTTFKTTTFKTTTFKTPRWTAAVAPSPTRQAVVPGPRLALFRQPERGTSLGRRDKSRKVNDGTSAKTRHNLPAHLDTPLIQFDFHKRVRFAKMGRSVAASLTFGFVPPSPTLALFRRIKSRSL